MAKYEPWKPEERVFSLSLLDLNFVRDFGNIPPAEVYSDEGITELQYQCDESAAVANNYIWGFLGEAAGF